MKNKTILMKLAVTALVGLAVVASPAVWAKGKKEKTEAVSGPSAQETVQFINGLWVNKFDVYIRADSYGSYNNTSYQYNGKLEQHNLQITLDSNATVKVTNGTVYYADESSDSLPLDKLLPNVQPYTDGSLKVSCNPSAGACIENKTLDWNCDITQKIDGQTCTPDTVKRFRKTVSNQNLTSTTLRFPTQEGAERAAKALKHLIEISGGKASLF